MHSLLYLSFANALSSQYDRLHGTLLSISPTCTVPIYRLLREKKFRSDRTFMLSDNERRLHAVQVFSLVYDDANYY